MRCETGTTTEAAGMCQSDESCVKNCMKVKEKVMGVLKGRPRKRQVHSALASSSAERSRQHYIRMSGQASPLLL